MCAKPDKEYLIKLTLAVYRVTELFPEEGNNLRHQIRESANKTLADLLYSDVGRPNAAADLLRLFKEAERKNWVDSRNFLVLRREYEKVAELSHRESGALRSHEPSFAKASDGSPSPSDLLGRSEALWRRRGKTVENSPFEKKNSGHNNHRQEKIMEVVKENGQVRVRDLNQFFPQFNRRTLIRDLDKLCRSGVVMRVGSNGRGVYYKRNGNVTPH